MKWIHLDCKMGSREKRVELVNVEIYKFVILLYQSMAYEINFIMSEWIDRLNLSSKGKLGVLIKRK